MLGSEVLGAVGVADGLAGKEGRFLVLLWRRRLRLRHFVLCKQKLFFLALVDFVNLLLHLELKHLLSLSIEQVVLKAKLVR